MNFLPETLILVCFGCIVILIVKMSIILDKEGYDSNLYLIHQDYPKFIELIKKQGKTKKRLFYNFILWGQLAVIVLLFLGLICIFNFLM